MLPNYRNYWKEAGYIEEMAAIETAIAENRRDDIPKYLPDRWIADNTLYGLGRESARPARRLVRCRRQHPGARPELVNGNQLTASRKSSRHSSADGGRLRRQPLLLRRFPINVPWREWRSPLPRAAPVINATLRRLAPAGL